MDNLPSIQSSTVLADADRGLKSGEERLRSTSREFEKMFVAEMLRLTELGGAAAGEFSGGFGEEAFRSFMIDAYAEQIVSTGQFGIAETIFAALSRKEAP